MLGTEAEASRTPTPEERAISRGRLLGAAAAAFFGLVTGRMAKSDPALAWHGPPPSPCSRWGPCHSCNGADCTFLCRKEVGCNGNWGCWYARSPYTGHLWVCCDWREYYAYHVPCICAAYIPGY